MPEPILFAPFEIDDTVRADGAAAARTESEPLRQRPPRVRNPKRDDKDHGRKFRRASGIHAYIGGNGTGKSAMMCFDTIPTLRGMKWRCDELTHRHMRDDYVDPVTGVVGATTTGIRTVLSTVALYDAETGLPHPLYTRLNSANGGWNLVINAEHCDILFDEVTGIAGSRESMGMPVAVQNILQQLRKRDVLMRWTAPRWERADSIIRGCTNAVTLCRGYLPDNRLVRSMAEPPAWIPNRLFKARTFDARDFDDFNAAKGSADRKQGSKVSALRAKPVAFIWGVGSEMFASYDSYGQVSRIAEYLDGGRCAGCGGTRRVPACRCDD